MSDIIDDANDAIQIQLDSSINAIRNNKDKVYYHHCLYCQEPTINGSKFCDKDCADDYEKIQRSKAMKKF